MGRVSGLPPPRRLPRNPPEAQGNSPVATRTCRAVGGGNVPIPLTPPTPVPATADPMTPAC